MGFIYFMKKVIPFGETLIWTNLALYDILHGHRKSMIPWKLMWHVVFWNLDMWKSKLLSCSKQHHESTFLYPVYRSSPAFCLVYYLKIFWMHWYLLWHDLRIFLQVLMTKKVKHVESCKIMPLHLIILFAAYRNTYNLCHCVR